VRKALFIVAVAAALWLAPGALAAGWCGSGESAADRSDVVTGAQVHAIVATPSDSPDQFAAVANKLQDDVDSVRAWWEGQDPTRVPRFDDATFPGGTCLDISFVHLPQPASAYAGVQSAFSGIGSALQSAGLLNPWKNYLVYYDGPSVETDVCGAGAGSFDQGSEFAMVFLNGCTDVPDDSVMAHELLHAFGALPAGAPNWCRASPVDGSPDTGHPCDSPTDVLYPVTDGRPLQQQVLDFNHDDYYGHSGSWPDIQDSIFLHHLNTPEEALGLSIAGAGSVASDLPGVDCTASCSSQWDQGSTVTLTPTPTSTSRFIHWTGACVGSADCVLDLSNAVSVNAVFGPAVIPVKVLTTGNGHVACTPSCSRRFSAGTRLTLRAVAAKGWRFARWGGACSGTRPTCTPKTDYAVTARASFTKKR
jgi:Divergent InlB B-repeat domain